MIAERLLEAFKEPFKLSEVDDTQVIVRASVGIATDVRSSAEELLRDADIAMYRAKWSGKNRYLVFESGMQDEVQSRLEIEMEVGGSYSPGDIVLDWSDDGGVTFTGGPRTMNVGSTLETRKRVYATRLGSFRNRVFRVAATHAFTIFAVDADITAGNH